MALDPQIRRQFAQQGRLWLLSLLCAVGGTVAIVRTGSLSTGIFVFLGCLGVLGPLLWLYERRRKTR
ncbi:MAG: hypothetical protein JWP61_1892 [Friedmanniella sp.]|nr:hypothetical protein [Friedmanniella sp.]